MRQELLAIKKMNADNGNYENLFSDIFETYPEKTFVEYKDGGEIKSITYAQYAKAVQNVADKLSYAMSSVPDKGFVALKYGNSPKWFMIFWGLLMCGKNVLLIDNRSEKKLTETLIKVANAQAIVCGQDDKNDYSVLKTVFEEIEVCDRVVLNFKPNWANKIALCTSGTTATSKVYVYQATSFIRLFKATTYLYRNYDRIFLDGNDKALIMLPLNHVFGLMTAMWMSSIGNTIVFPKNSTPKAVFSACKEHSVNWLFSVPVFWNRTAEQIEADTNLTKESFQEQIEKSISLQMENNQLSGDWVRKNCLKDVTDLINSPTLRILISGGGPIPEKTLKTVNALGYNLMNGYGSTEVGIVSLCAVNDIKQRIIGSVGTPLHSIEYGIMENGSGSEVKCITNSGIGELLLKCPWMHCGKLIDGKYAPQDVDADGWYHTGDIVKIDNGSISLKGREKSVIINESGENIYPEELELYFAYLPYCLRADVVGIKDLSQNEQVTLVLYLSCDLSEDNKMKELINEFNKLNNKLPLYKMVKNLYAEPKAKNLKTLKSKKNQICKLIEENCGRFHKINFCNDIENKSINEAAASAVETPCNYEDNQTLKNELKQIISKVTGHLAENIPDNENLIECLNVSSLTMMEVFVEIEDAYEITIPSTDYNKYLTVNKMMEGIIAKQVKISS